MKPTRVDVEDGEVKEEKKPLNDAYPLWLKNPKDCKDEEYREFLYEGIP